MSGVSGLLNQGELNRDKNRRYWIGAVTKLQGTAPKIERGQAVLVAGSQSVGQSVSRQSVGQSVS